MTKVLKEHEWDKIKEDEIFSEITDDRVLDFIDMFGPETSEEVLKCLGEKGGKNISFKIDDNFYGFIHKFAKVGDSGLLLVIAKSPKVLATYVYNTFEAHISEPMCKQILELKED